jgi:hypothetical protein
MLVGKTLLVKNRLECMNHNIFHFDYCSGAKNMCYVGSSIYVLPRFMGYNFSRTYTQ